MTVPPPGLIPPLLAAGLVRTGQNRHITSPKPSLLIETRHPRPAYVYASLSPIFVSLGTFLPSARNTCYFGGTTFFSLSSLLIQGGLNPVIDMNSVWPTRTPCSLVMVVQGCVHDPG